MNTINQLEGTKEDSINQDQVKQTVSAILVEKKVILLGNVKQRMYQQTNAHKTVDQIMLQKWDILKDSQR